MTSPNLPPDVVAFVRSTFDGSDFSALKHVHAAMSEIYRSGGHSNVAVATRASALAYAAARMPATYAACVRAFDLASGCAPAFAPHSILDVGAGPGTATLAAAAVWPSLKDACLVEPNAQMAATATTLLPLAGLASVRIESGGAPLDTRDLAAADVVVLSYVLAEQPLEMCASLALNAAKYSSTMVMVVEPGTPEGYSRVLAARAALIGSGFMVLAPCTHQKRCPLPAGDWCHFSVRLQRSALHRDLKNADVPFEDERFAFLAAVRTPFGAAPTAAARLIKPARIEKGFADLPLCTPTGLETRHVMRRSGAAYKAAKKLEWGDAVGENRD